MQRAACQPGGRAATANTAGCCILRLAAIRWKQMVVCMPCLLQAAANPSSSAKGLGLRSGG